MASSGSGSSGALAGNSGRSEPGSIGGKTARVLDRLEVVRHQVDDRVRGRAEVGGGHVAELGRGRSGAGCPARSVIAPECSERRPTG